MCQADVVRKQGFRPLGGLTDISWLKEASLRLLHVGSVPGMAEHAHRNARIGIPLVGARLFLRHEECHPAKAGLEEIASCHRHTSRSRSKNATTRAREIASH
jgi:hypothetical protein